MNAITLYILAGLFDFSKLAGRFVGGNVAHGLGQYAETTRAGVALLMVILLARFMFRRGIFMRL